MINYRTELREIRPDHFPSVFFPTLCSLIVVTLHSIQYQLLTVSLSTRKYKRNMIWIGFVRELQEAFVSMVMLCYVMLCGRAPAANAPGCTAA